MKTPKKQKKIIEEDSFLFESHTVYTPEDLREIASEMESEGVISVEFHIGGYEGYFECLKKRLETDKELEARHKKELALHEKFLKNKEKRKQQLIKEAKQLGLKISE